MSGLPIRSHFNMRLLKDNFSVLLKLSDKGMREEYSVRILEYDSDKVIIYIYKLVTLLVTEM